MMDTALEALMISLAGRAPRVLVLSAPAGHRKARAIRAFTGLRRDLLTCTLPSAGADADLAWTIVEALTRRDEGASARVAADRLAQRRTGMPTRSRELLRLEWTVSGTPDVVLLRDPDGALSGPRGAELLSELLMTSPPERTVAIATRAPLPRALQQLVEDHAAVGVGAEQLVYSFRETAAAADKAGLPNDAASEIHRIAAGWPLVCDLLLHLAVQGDAQELLDAARAVRHDRLLSFTIHRTIARLPADVREALIVAVLFGTCTLGQLARVLPACDEAVFESLTRLPLCRASNGQIETHPEIRVLISARFAAPMGELYEHTLRVLAGEGAYVDAARVALDAGDAMRAAAIVDAAPPYTVAPVPLAAFAKIIDLLDPALITRFPNMWIATIPHRSLSVHVSQFVREAETVNFCLPASASDDQRAAILMLLASSYVNVGRTGEAYALIEEGLHGFARQRGPARAAILNLYASLRGIDGHFSEARALASAAAGAAPAPDSFGENQTLHYIDSHEAAYRGKHQRVVVIIDELLRRRKDEGLPLYLAYAAASGAIFSWAAGDDSSFERYLSEMEDAMTPGLEPGFAPIIDAARGRTATLTRQEPWPAFSAMEQLYRIGAANSDAEAITAARASAAAADVRKDPYIQILAHAAVYVLDASSHQNESVALAELVQPIESDEMKAAVSEILAGGAGGILEPFLRRIRRHVAHDENIAVELLAGRIVQESREIRLTEKEFEVLALLASSRAGLSRNRIGEAVWDYLEPEEWRNNLKVTVHRIRRKLGRPDAIVFDGSALRLGSDVDTDLRRIEATVRDGDLSALGDATRRHLREIVAAFDPAAMERYGRYAWGQQLVARIADAVCRAAEAYGNDACVRGAYDEAEWAAERIREVDPFNETACELAMRASLARGNADAARRELARYAHELARELDAAPSPRLTGLVSSVI